MCEDRGLPDLRHSKQDADVGGLHLGACGFVVRAVLSYAATYLRLRTHHGSTWSTISRWMDEPSILTLWLVSTAAAPSQRFLVLLKDSATAVRNKNIDTEGAAKKCQCCGPIVLRH